MVVDERKERWDSDHLARKLVVQGRRLVALGISSSLVIYSFLFQPFADRSSP